MVDLLHSISTIALIDNKILKEDKQFIIEKPTINLHVTDYFNNIW